MAGHSASAVPQNALNGVSGKALGKSLGKIGKKAFRGRLSKVGMIFSVLGILIGVAVKALPSAVTTRLKQGDPKVIKELIRFAKEAGVILKEEEGKKIVTEIKNNKKQLVKVFKELAVAFATI